MADAYEAMAHAPQDPAVKEAYENLIKQTTAQYQALADAGYKFWFIDPSIPSNADYASTPWNAMRDMRANQQMGVFATSDGFGTSEEFNPEDNPLFADTGIKWPVGGPDGPLKPVLANDLFRAVHDAFGHGLEGAGFRAEGEENAWQAHSRLFTGSALGAITSETRGQNSWLNYGPHGETNQTAKVEDTHFADQKTGLMPEWTWTEGRAGNEGENKYQAKYLAGRQLDSLNAEERAQYDAMATPSDVLNAPNARGTFNPKSMTISLLEGADLSTFHHEMAHFYLEVLANIASQPNAPVAIVNDMMELLKWFGVKDLPTWNAMSLNEKRASHEKFAEHYEQYLFEGKSPNPEMQTLFRRFASWMKNVYQSLQAFMLSHNSNLTPEVRGVYDRMLATEAQIDQAEAARNYAPLFKSAEQAGMTPEAWALYQLQAQDATEQAIENLQARSLRDLKWTMRAKNKAFKEATKDVEAKRKAVEAEVSDEVNAMPVYAAKSYLDSLKGERTDADIQLASELFGYSSPNEMLRDITEAQPIKHVIEGMTDQRLLERYGDLTTPAGIERAANEAVHNEARARFVATELKALNEGMRITTPERSTILEKLKECLAS